MSARNPQERRLDRRIPLGCPAFIRQRGQAPVPADCLEISVRGMTLVAAFVPGESEVLEVEVCPPGRPGGHPLRAKLRVTRCHPVAPGRFEIGGETLYVIE